MSMRRTKRSSQGDEGKRLAACDRWPILDRTRSMPDMTGNTAMVAETYIH